MVCIIYDANHLFDSCNCQCCEIYIYIKFFSEMWSLQLKFS
jgi:hypothetical protein